MIRIHELTKSRKSVNVTYQEQTGEVVYCPENYTPELEEKAEAASESQFQTKVLITLLSGLIVEMPGVVDEQEKPLTPAHPMFKQFPLDFYIAVMKAIGEDMRGKDPQQPSGE